MSSLSETAARGRFITFEGGEGSGKTTQIALLATRLREAGHEVVATREPGGTPGANALRHIILSGTVEALGNEMEAILFAAARLDHLQSLIQPALERGAVVLCDRFHDSTRAYQGSRPGADTDFLSVLETATLETGRPDLTFVLDIPAEAGLQRAAGRRGAGKADRFEKEDVALHEARRQAFLDIAADEPGRCAIVDARGDVGSVAAAIADALSARLPSLLLPAPVSP
ncbi:dTMP kinase [Aureimonas pseudogalii]|uniref:Thymidylate kinase n=1 Tax=Aureimonas pseudogalii TaxID=1744844 RepID=A0A7W6H8I4_9HYPH|nr:dTMP kinase [Aureimonas pseudogalii]MBB4000580.1 dTMP kinase [Aureimonas pseudogalii]